MAGIVATNTTISRPDNEGIMSQNGGLSGQPPKSRSTEVIRLIADHTNGEWPIIGVGGIANSEDAWEKIVNGASRSKFIHRWYSMELQSSKKL